VFAVVVQLNDNAHKDIFRAARSDADTLVLWGTEGMEMVSDHFNCGVEKLLTAGK
jgi:hypothetical protein